MPLSIQDRLKISQSDPSFIDYVFGGIRSEDLYLEQRLGGNYEKYEEMLLDPQVRGKLTERVGAVLGRALIVTEGGRSKQDRAAANTAKFLLDSAAFPYEQICNSFLLSGLLMGFSVMAVTEAYEETIFEPYGRTQKEKTVLLPRLEFVPQRRFIFTHFEPEKDVPVCTDEKVDPKKDIVLINGYELRLLTKRAQLQGERCPKDRFFVFNHGSVKGLPHGYGLGAQIRKFYEIRNEVLRSGVLAGDKLGSPPVHGTYPEDFDPQDPENTLVLSAFNALLRMLSPNANASTSEGFKINFLEPGKTGGQELLKWLYDLSALEVERAIWGGGSYAEKDTGSYAAEAAQNQSRNENITDGDCNSLDEQMQSQFWKWIGDRNYPDARYPMIRRETAAERRKLQAENEEEDLRGKRISNDRTLIVDFGLTLKPEAVPLRYGEDFSLPEPEEEPTEETAAPIEGEGEEIPPEEAELLEEEPTEQLEEAEELTEFAEGVKLKDLERNEKGQYKYQGEWWTLNKPKNAPKDSTKKKRVLASKVINGVTYVKLISFGHRDYDHNYSKDARKSYLKRSAGITDKDGNPTAKDRHSPNYWSRNTLWDANYSESLKVGSVVKWKYGKGTATGKVAKIYKKPITLKLGEADVTRNGSEENPAILIRQENGSEVLKLMSEVTTVEFIEPIEVTGEILSDEDFEALAEVTEADVLAAVEGAVEEGLEDG